MKQLTSISKLGMLFLLMAAFTLAPQESMAQKKKKGKTEEAAPAAPKKETIKGKLKACTSYDGLFVIYQDTTNGELWMEVKDSQLNKEFIYFAHGMNGVIDAGVMKGSYMGSSVFTITKYFNRLDFQIVPTQFYFDPENPLSRAEDANISVAKFFSGKIEVDEDGRYLVKADDLFLSESLKQLVRSSENPRAFNLGRLDPKKSTVLGVYNYPENSDVEIEYTFSNPTPKNGGSVGVTDARSVNLRVRHSFIAMPENDYQPRYDDPRVGYFSTQVTDMTSNDVTPYRDVIHRWNLVKKNPEQAISEPVEPITWWIENTTPLEWRDVITEAVMEWNKAFEKAGFRNAMVVQVQPDTADWDAGDIRYNVLRWTSSPNPPFGGYGPSFVNPRTGQIMGADIMLEWIYMTNRVRYDKLYNPTSMEHEVEFEHLHGEDFHYCSFGEQMQSNLMFGAAAAMAAGAPSEELDGLMREGLKELIMHEVGHTLGLNHNMKSSQLWSPAELYNPELIKGKALTGSVMDYVLINVVPERTKQGHYFSTTVGPYDMWAIQYGYTPFSSGAEEQALLNRSTEPQLIFGNDADDMRSPGKAIDPRVNVGDQSNDQITYCVDRMQLIKEMIPGLKDKFVTEGKSYQELRQMFSMMVSSYFGMGDVITRFIGGVYVDRAMAGQEGGTQPYTPASLADQKRAMKALADYIFAPDALVLPEDYMNYMAMQRRGFNFFMGTEDPKIHAMVLQMQSESLDHLMHPVTMARIVNSQLYGNKYDLNTMMSDLTKAIFEKDINGTVNPMRQNLQVEYTNRLIAIFKNKGGDYSYLDQAAALSNLKAIQKMAVGGAGSTKAHKEFLNYLIESALDT